MLLMTESVLARALGARPRKKPTIRLCLSERDGHHALEEVERQAKARQDTRRVGEHCRLHPPTSVYCMHLMRHIHGHIPRQSAHTAHASGDLHRHRRLAGLLRLGRLLRCERRHLYPR